MADRDEWKQQKRQFIDRFFREKVPKALGKETLSSCTEDACIQFAKSALGTEHLSHVDNQGSNSFTLQTPGIIIQFRLKSLKTDIIALANELYGHLVPKVKSHGGFPLPVYSTYPGPVTPRN
ncbi:hypothetical protein N7533_011268 [Penicillium manginii]|jgi:hypothetical protein|uniref:uncharacterized protein n=1 Tax=Penicillium manginii TaxID=203109 RepID=UPI002546D12F|nr:uncharacterized protein N7533_011268 [Penicillium manginii]KAJ5741859.1 hypothetical protein N7533_011268 [Penicillium manginii]